GKKSFLRVVLNLTILVQTYRVVLISSPISLLLIYFLRGICLRLSLMGEVIHQTIPTTAPMCVAILILTSPKLLSLLPVCLAQMAFARVPMEASMVTPVIGHRPTGQPLMRCVLFTQMVLGVGLPPEMLMSPTLS